MPPISKPGTGSSSDLKWHELKYNGLTLKYTLRFWGAQPKEGYPLYIGLHGGGEKALGNLASNDESWRQFSLWGYPGMIQKLLGPDVTKPGAAYIACRGVSSLTEQGQLKDEYNIHWRPECYVLYQQMISNIIQKSPPELQANYTDWYKGTLNPAAWHFVDSNRIHLLGFSAGGDGAFNLTRCMPDLFASTVPAAGYATDQASSKSFFQNLANLPVCLQVGEMDDMYFDKDEFGRSQRATFYYNYHDAMNQLSNQTGNTGLYWHNTYIVKDGTHDNWATWKTGDANVDCLNNLDKWYSSFTDATARTSTSTDVNAVRWASSRKRQMPQRVIWNLGQRPEKPKLLNGVTWEQKRFFYWLFDRKPSQTEGLKTTIFASFGTQNGASTIYVNDLTKNFGLLLRGDMVLFNNLTVVCTKLNFSKAVTLTRNRTIEGETYDARGDTSLTFSAMLYFEQRSGVWDIKVAASLADGGGEALKGRLVPDIVPITARL